MEDLIKSLINSNLKLVSKETGIPYDRMYKWVKGKAAPKTQDFSTLLNYFNKSNDSPRSNSNEDNDLSQKSQNEQKVQPIGNNETNGLSGVNFNDIGKVSNGSVYKENSTHPEAADNKGDTPQWRQLYNIQQEEINLLNRKIELLNQLIQQ